MDEKIVLVRGFKDKASTLVLTGACDDRLEVSSKDGSASLLVPPNDVYEFDGKLMAEINDARSSGDAKRASKLWSRAKHLAGEAS